VLAEIPLDTTPPEVDGKADVELDVLVEVDGANVVIPVVT
jgi:hypothetical protein